MKFGLDDKVIEDIQKIFQDNWKINSVVVFGSRAKGNYRENSDIDLSIKGRDITFDDILSLKSKLGDLNLPHEIDLINYSTIKDEDVIEHIDRVGIVFYERWREYKFSEFIEINPVIKYNDRKNVSFIEMKDLNDGIKNCYPSIERELTGGARFENDDTLFARITPCLENGKISQVKGLKDGVGFGSTEFLIFRARKSISHKDFVFYLSRWGEVRGYAESHFEGTSGRQRVPKNCFDNLLLNLPPYEEQEVIADVLSSLDDKIDLLQRQNKTLEQLAETLFRQWFVEEASEDWEVGTLDDEFEFSMGQSPEGVTLNEDQIGIIFYQGRSDFGFRFPEPRVYTTSPTRLAKKFDTLVSVRAPVGDMNMAIEECCLGRGVAAFRYKHNRSFYTYTYYKMRSLMLQIKQFEDNGSVFGSIGKDDFKKIENDIPPKSLIEKFEKEVKTLDAKIYLNTTQIHTLTQLRDALLPKLMSGEVRVEVF